MISRWYEAKPAGVKFRMPGWRVTCIVTGSRWRAAAAKTGSNCGCPKGAEASGAMKTWLK
jgi:hypothetical protein